MEGQMASADAGSSSSSQGLATLSVCIVGGGIMGLMTAYYLAESRRCLRITIVEEGEIAGGASGKAAGFLAKRWHGATTHSLGVLSYALHQTLAETLDGTTAYGYRPMSTLSVHVEEGKGLSEADRVRVLGTLDWLNTENVSQIEEMDDEEGTAQVHPRLFCQAIERECRRMGVHFMQARAEGAEKFSEGRYAIRTRDRQGREATVDAQKLIIAAGPWSGTTSERLLGRKASSDVVRVGSLPGHSIVIRTRRSLPSVAIFASVCDKTGTRTLTPELFTRPDGTVYVAGENSGAPLPPGTKDVVQTETSLDKLKALCKLISSHLDVDDATRVDSFTTALCYRPLSERGYPVLGQIPDLANAFLVAGHGPWGISLGPGSGKVMSEIVLDGKAKSANVDYLQP